MRSETRRVETREDHIQIPEHRARARLDEPSVSRLMDSMAKIGLQTPISLRATDDGDLFLVAGRHRLEAARRLGWEEIDATITYDWTSDEARMWEISENLARAELTALERDEHVAEWIRLAEKPPQDEPVFKGGRGNESGVRKAARDLGIEKEDARRATKVAGLSDEAKDAAREAGLDDNRSALLEASRKPTTQDQVESLRMRAASKKEPKIAADPLSDTLASEKQVARLMDAWNAAGPEAREEFMLRIDAPVFDRGAVEREFGARG
jgi:ParB-like chromosome segregation protein Spo0J